MNAPGQLPWNGLRRSHRDEAFFQQRASASERSPASPARIYRSSQPKAQLGVVDLVCVLNKCRNWRNEANLLAPSPVNADRLRGARPPSIDEQALFGETNPISVEDDIGVSMTRSTCGTNLTAPVLSLSSQ